MFRLTDMKQLSDGTIIGKNNVYVPIPGQPGKMRVYPSCGSGLDKDELENLGNLVYFESEDEVVLSQFFMTLSVKEKYEIFEKVANAPIRGEIPSMAFKEEIKKKYDERKETNMLLTNTTANTVISGTSLQSDSIDVAAPNAVSSGICLQSDSVNVGTSRQANQLNEKKACASAVTTSKQVKPYNDYHSAFGYGLRQGFESGLRQGLFGGNPAIHGVAFGPNDEVYLMICGQRCEIYPNDDSGRVEVELIRNLDIQEFMKAYQKEHGKHIPGGKINRLQKALAKWRRMLTPFSTKQFKGPVFDKIVFSGNATILIDTYGKKEKTVVKCMDGESYDPEKALLTALFIREYGKNAYHDLMEICHETYVECGEPNKPKPKKKTAKKAVSKSSASMARSTADTLQAFADSTKKTAKKAVSKTKNR